MLLVSGYYPDLGGLGHKPVVLTHHPTLPSYKLISVKLSIQDLVLWEKAKRKRNK